MVYKYTKPRGPIAATHSSPGPCYELPGLMGQHGHDPRSSHCRGPAYAFGVRHRGAVTGGSSPGPCYLPDAKTYRDGRDGSPWFSLGSRHRDPGPLSGTPGPGAYSPEASAPAARHASPPAYSFGSRHRTRLSSDFTPGLYRINVEAVVDTFTWSHVNLIDSSRPRPHWLDASSQCGRGP